MFCIAPGRTQSLYICCCGREQLPPPHINNTDCFIVELMFKLYNTLLIIVICDLYMGGGRARPRHHSVSDAGYLRQAPPFPEHIFHWATVVQRILLGWGGGVKLPVGLGRMEYPLRNGKIFAKIEVKITNFDIFL